MSFGRPISEKNPLVQYASQETDEEELEAPSPMNPNLAWQPSLGPAQQSIYESQARFILAYGERGSGKSYGAVHKLVDHCWNNMNALAIMVVGVKRQAHEGGVAYKLMNEILPLWKAGRGLDYTDWKSNAAKDDFCYISNKYGGWSRVLLLSMPVPSFIKDRSKGLEPSFMLVDEAQTLQTDEYFSVLIQQLGRRTNIVGPQQYVATANPDGPSHWLYKRFFEKPRAESGEWDVNYLHVHVPIVENLDNLPDGYYTNVIEAVKDDPVEYRRMVLGEWIDRPSGDAIFATSFNEELHIKGDLKTGKRLMPMPNYDVILGYDLGSANSGIVFLQNIPTKDKDIWVAFDEIAYHDRHIPYYDLVPAIQRRMDFWNKTVKTKFNFVHISDASAFNAYRATHGTYDALEVERISLETGKVFPDLPPIKMLECPKFPGSVPGRVRCTIKMLQQERLFISASCVNLKKMFLHLECEKMNDKKYAPDLPFNPKRSKHIHIFDALSYALFYYELGQRPLSPPPDYKPELIFLGSRR